MVISVLASEERTIWVERDQGDQRGIRCLSFARYWGPLSGLISGDRPIRTQKWQRREAANPG